MMEIVAIQLCVVFLSAFACIAFLVVTVML